MRKNRLFLALLASLSLLSVVPSAAVADEGAATMQERVDEVIAAEGGVQTGWNEVSWDDGAVVLELASTDEEDATSTVAVAAAADDCASGRYCAYAKAGYTGNKLTYSACPATYTSFSALGGAPRSVKNDVSGHTVRVYGGSTVKATLGGGTGVSNVSGVTKITCS